MEHSKSSPSLTTFNNALWVAFTGLTTNDLYVCSSSDGLNWSEGTKMDHLSAHAPALAVFQGKLWAAYLADNSADLVVASSADGNAWSEAWVTGQTTIAPPALAVFQDKLWAAFIAQNGSNDLLVCSSADGVHWSAATPVPNESSKSYPTLAVYGGKLWIGFVGNTNASLYVYSSVDGKTWAGAGPTLAQASNASPSLAVHGGDLWMGFITADTSGNLLVCSCNGTQWSASTAIQGTGSSAGPSLAEYGGRLYAAFVFGELLFICSSPHGKNWGPASVIGNYPEVLSFPLSDQGFGSGATNANVQATLTLYQDGTVNFAGQYQDSGTIPWPFDAPPQTYSAVAVIAASNNQMFTFVHNNTKGVPTGGAIDPWNITRHSPEIAASWPELAMGKSVTFKCKNNSNVWGDLGSFLGSVVSGVETALGIYAGAAPVIAIIAA